MLVIIQIEQIIQIIQNEKGGFMYTDFSGKRDVYLDIADRYIQYIKLGVIKCGEKLPSVRDAAGDMGVNPNTVAKAYQTLEEQGYVRSVPKKGAFVIFDGEAKEKTDGELAVIRAVKQSGMSKQEILELIEEVYSEND